LIRDHNAEVFNPPNSVKPNTVDHIVDIALGGFRRWDALYFLHISEYGYTYENTLAFFPLFPLVVRCVAHSVLFPLQLCMSYASVLLISAVIVNTVCFVLSAISLYQLGQIVLGSDVLAFRAAQFYCINPASVFFSAAYSESCYALLAFRGMLLLERNLWISSAIFFALSGAARSNGLVNIGFLLYRTACDMVAWHKVKARISVIRFALYVCRLAMVLLLCFVPFLAFQHYAYTIFCDQSATYQDLPEHIRQYGNKLGYRMPYMEQSAWCSSWPQLSYSYIQSSHWNIGFLNYYELKQIPNFMLATPMALLCACMTVSYLMNHPLFCLSVGLLPHQCSSKKCFVYVVHTTVLLIFGILFMHVQVILVKALILPHKLHM